MSSRQFVFIAGTHKGVLLPVVMPFVKAQPIESCGDGKHELHLGLQKMFSRILTTLEHRAIIVTNAKPVFPLKNCVLVSTKVAYRYTPTASVSIVASNQRQLRKPISSGILIASTMVGWLGEDWLFAAVVETGIFAEGDADASGATGFDGVLGLALFLPPRGAVALEFM